MRRFLVALMLLLLALDGRVNPQEAPSPSPSSTSTSTTTTVAPTTTTTEPPPTTTTTTTTQAPAPVTTVAPRPPRTDPPVTAAPPTTAAPVAGAADPCGRAMVGIWAVGLPAGFTIHCSASKAQGHAGLAWWESDGVSHSGFVAISPSTGNFEGVGAHEACHIQQFIEYGASSEPDADACARAHGWPNPYE